MTAILVVDDSRVIRRVARSMLEKLGFNVSEADTGEAALESCRASQPTGILLDWNMPVMDGLTFLKKLRMEPGGDGPKVVFCTTENDMAHITAALEAGADEYLMKPFDEEILRSKLSGVGLM